MIWVKDKIRTEDEYRRVMIRYFEIYDAPKGTTEGDEATQLAQLLEDYENEYFRQAIHGEYQN